MKSLVCDASSDAQAHFFTWCRSVEAVDLKACIHSTLDRTQVVDCVVWVTERFRFGETLMIKEVDAHRAVTVHLCASTHGFRLVGRDLYVIRSVDFARMVLIL